VDVHTVLYVNSVTHVPVNVLKYKPELHSHWLENGDTDEQLALVIHW
jgi:hypothetical protein